MTAEPGDRLWEAGVRWAATLAEPLLAPHRRQLLEAELAAAVHAAPDWGCRFFAGVAFDTAQTLPLADPWRGTTVVDGVAMLGGRRFGTVADHADLVPQVMPDLSIDVALVAVADDIPPSSALVVAGSFHSDVVVADTISAAADEPGGIVAVGEAALRWLTFRRRCYVGLTDLWVYDSCWWRSEFEWKALRGEIDTDEARTFAADRIGRERIPDDAYRADDGDDGFGLAEG